MANELRPVFGSIVPPRDLTGDVKIDPGDAVKGSDAKETSAIADDSDVLEKTNNTVEVGLKNRASKLGPGEHEVEQNQALSNLTKLAAVPSPKDVTAASLIAHYNQVATQIGRPELSPKDIDRFEKLDSNSRSVLDHALLQIEAYQRKEISAADYMTRVMSHAAEVSQGRGEVFVDLVGMVFSEPQHAGYFDSGPKKGVERLGRRLLGTVSHPVGSKIEMLHRHIYASQKGAAGATGFNPNVLETARDGDATSTMTHHFAAFLEAGANRPGAMLGNIAVTFIDDPEENPVDVRNGFFAVMIGNNLAKGKLKPADAVELTRWAYATEHSRQAAPPWGKNRGKGTYLEPGDYKIQDWVRAYNEAFPKQPVTLL